MKKILMTCIILFSVAIAYSQTTYYWTGGSGPVSFTSNANWNTALDGSGTARGASDPTDILIFDGSNIGGVVAATGTVVATVTATSCAQIILQNNASVNLQRISSGSGTITVGGNAGDDLVVPAGCNLSITSTDAGGSALVVLGSAATGAISGNVSISGGGCRLAALNTTPGGALFFEDGSVCTVNVVSSGAYPFGGSTSHTADKGIVFKRGATLIRQGGNSVFGNTSTFNPIVFQTGSTMVFEAGEVPGLFSNRTYADVVVRPSSANPSTPVSVTVNGTNYNIDNLTIEPNAAFNLQATGVTPISGNILNNGTFGAVSNVTSSNLLLHGLTPQTIGGSGTFNPLGTMSIGAHADVTLNTSLQLIGTATGNISGKLNVQGHVISGTANIQLRAPQEASFTANTTLNSYSVTGVSDFSGVSVGALVSGPGIQPNTFVIGTNSSSLTFTISKPATASATGAGITLTTYSPTLATSNANGIDGSFTTTGTRTFGTDASYIFNGATATPFSVASVNPAKDVTFNAPVTLNNNLIVNGTLAVNAGKLTIPAGNVLHLTSGNPIAGGPFNDNKYIVSVTDKTTGEKGLVRFSNMTASTLIPIGTATHYLPATLSPSTASEFEVSVFEGITQEGTVNGTPLTSLRKQTVVDAVWNISRTAGNGNCGIQLQWSQTLEGTSFTTFDDADIGIIAHENGAWTLPLAAGDNAANKADGNVDAFGAFSVGAQPPSQPFIFNPLPNKTYGDADFNAGVISSNTTTPISYTSSNTAVAVIVGTDIRIVGTGTTDITASQATDGFYPAVSVTQSLVVNKADLTIKADDKVKPEGFPNPDLTITYSGFVKGENQSVLTKAVTVTTTATVSSPAGTYPITVSGATAVNYNLIFEPGTLTVVPRKSQTITFNALPAKTYGNGDFVINASSTNTTIPITYTSSNTAVATITGNSIHITGAGTAVITASQAGSDLYYPATDATQTLVVNKANLTIKATDTTRMQGASNPSFTITYTGFVNGEGVTNLTGQPIATTSATGTSLPGYYPITVSGAASGNYNITYVAGRLTVLPTTGVDKAYLNAYKSNSNTLTVRIFMTTPSLGAIHLYDVRGQLLMSKNVFLPQGFMSFTLPVGNLASGVYTIVATGENVNLKKNISIIR